MYINVSSSWPNGWTKLAKIYLGNPWVVYPGQNKGKKMFLKFNRHRRAIQRVRYKICIPTKFSSTALFTLHIPYISFTGLLDFAAHSS